MASVEELCHDLEEKMDVLRSRQSRRDQFINDGTKVPSEVNSVTNGVSSPSTLRHTDESQGSGQDIYLGNLPKGISEDELMETFREFNPIRSRILNHGDQYSYGFIRFRGMDDAKKAVMAGNGLCLKENRLSVRIVRDRSRARIIEEGVSRGMTRTDPSQSMTLHVGNLSAEMSEDEVTKLFTDYGGIANIVMRFTRDGLRQYARVTLRSEALAQQAIRERNSKIVGNNVITVALLRFPPNRFNYANRDGAQNGHHVAHNGARRDARQDTDKMVTARRLIQKIEVLSSEVLDSCDFCQRLQDLIHELQALLNGISR